MSDNSDLHSKLMSFLIGELARKEGALCVRIDLLYAPGSGFREEEIRKWVRADQPELFSDYANTEKLVSQIIEIATGEVDAKPPGKHSFVVKTLQHHNDRAKHSFVLLPAYSGGDDAALVLSHGGGVGPGRNDGAAALGVMMNHAGQLMRINAQNFEGTIRVLAAQSADMRRENAELHAENILLRREVEEARSNKLDREFQIAMAAEKNQRTNAGFKQLLQIGSVLTAKIAGGEAGATPSPLLILAGEFGKSLRPDQTNVLSSKAIPLFMNCLDMAQKIMFMELMNMFQDGMSKVAQEDGPPPNSNSGAALPPSSANGAPS